MSQRGVGTLLVAALLVLVVVLTGVGIWALGWVNSRHRVSAAADLSALAGAGAMASGQDACAVAAQAAFRSEVKLEECTVQGDASSFVVRVTVSGELRPVIGWADVPRRVWVTALAGTSDARP